MTGIKQVVNWKFLCKVTRISGLYETFSDKYQVAKELNVSNLDLCFDLSL